MGTLHCENIWRVTIGSFGVNGLNSKRMFEGQKNQTRKRSNLTPNIISTFFNNSIPYNKNGRH
jgi:hypothetical protein